MDNVQRKPLSMDYDLITTVPYSGDVLLEHEEMLLKCSRTGNVERLIELSGSVVDEEDCDFEITDPVPTKRISVFEREKKE